MNLLEILNTKVDVKWVKAAAHEHRGTFFLDDVKYVLQLDEYDEYDVLGKSLVDFGFTADGSIATANRSGNASRVIGAVLNAGMQKLAELKPDVILISVIKASGAVESRKSLYNEIAKWVSKQSGFTYLTGWLEGESMINMLLAKNKLTDAELQTFQQEATRAK